MVVGLSLRWWLSGYRSGAIGVVLIGVVWVLCWLLIVVGLLLITVVSGVTS